MRNLGVVVVLVVVGVAGACDSDVATPASTASPAASSSSASQGGGGASASSTASGAGGCEAQCESMYGAGRDELTALETCIYCEACFTLCEPRGYCPQGGREAGCSAMFSDCAECAYSTCSWDIDAGRGVCIDEYLACDGSPCIDLWACLDAC